MARFAVRQPLRYAYSAIAEPSSWATLPKLNASLPALPKRFGPIWSVPMHGAIVSLPALSDSWTTGVAKSTSHVVKTMCAPWPSRLAAHDLALAGLLLFVSQVTSLNGRPRTPPLALIWPMRIFAAASAGLSNGAMFPLLSNAQPITIGDAAFVAEPPSPVPATATTSADIASSAPRAPHRFLAVILASLWIPGLMPNSLPSP